MLQKNNGPRKTPYEINATHEYQVNKKNNRTRLIFWTLLWSFLTIVVGAIIAIVSLQFSCNGPKPYTEPIKPQGPITPFTPPVRPNGPTGPVGPVGPTQPNVPPALPSFSPEFDPNQQYFRVGDHFFSTRQQADEYEEQLVGAPKNLQTYIVKDGLGYLDVDDIYGVSSNMGNIGGKVDATGTHQRVIGDIIYVDDVQYIYFDQYFETTAVAVTPGFYKVAPTAAPGTPDLALTPDSQIISGDYGNVYADTDAVLAHLGLTRYTSANPQLQTETYNYVYPDPNHPGQTLSVPLSYRQASPAPANPASFNPGDTLEWNGREYVYSQGQQGGAGSNTYRPQVDPSTLPVDRDPSAWESRTVNGVEYQLVPHPDVNGLKHGTGFDPFTPTDPSRASTLNTQQVTPGQQDIPHYIEGIYPYSPTGVAEDYWNIVEYDGARQFQDFGIRETMTYNTNDAANGEMDFKVPVPFKASDMLNNANGLHAAELPTPLTFQLVDDQGNVVAEDTVFNFDDVAELRPVGTSSSINAADPITVRYIDPALSKEDAMLELMPNHGSGPAANRNIYTNKFDQNGQVATDAFKPEGWVMTVPQTQTGVYPKYNDQSQPTLGFKPTLAAAQTAGVDFVNPMLKYDMRATIGSVWHTMQTGTSGSAGIRQRGDTAIQNLELDPTGATWELNLPFSLSAADLPFGLSTTFTNQPTPQARAAVQNNYGYAFTGSLTIDQLNDASTPAIEGMSSDTINTRNSAVTANGDPIGSVTVYPFKSPAFGEVEPLMDFYIKDDTQYPDTLMIVFKDMSGANPHIAYPNQNPNNADRPLIDYTDESGAYHVPGKTSTMTGWEAAKDVLDNIDFVFPPRAGIDPKYTNIDPSTGQQYTDHVYATNRMFDAHDVFELIWESKPATPPTIPVPGAPVPSPEAIIEHEDVIGGQHLDDAIGPGVILYESHPQGPNGPVEYVTDKTKSTDYDAGDPGTTAPGWYENSNPVSSTRETGLDNINIFPSNDGTHDYVTDITKGYGYQAAGWYRRDGTPSPDLRGTFNDPATNTFYADLSPFGVQTVTVQDLADQHNNGQLNGLTLHYITAGSLTGDNYVWYDHVGQQLLVADEGYYPNPPSTTGGAGKLDMSLSMTYWFGQDRFYTSYDTLKTYLESIGYVFNQQFEYALINVDTSMIDPTTADNIRNFIVSNSQVGTVTQLPKPNNGNDVLYIDDKDVSADKIWEVFP